MTTMFDRLQRLLLEHKSKLSEVDFIILRTAIDAVHDLQHDENSHRIDNVIHFKIESCGDVVKKRWNRF